MTPAAARLVSAEVLMEEARLESVGPASKRRSAAESAQHAENRSAYIRSCVVGGGLAAVVFVLVLWNFSFDPLRTTDPSGVFSNFYDLQARAFLDGRLNVPEGALSIEAFVIDGRHYMYFPPLPALLRLPLFLVTDELDGDLTALSILLAWVLTTVLIVMLMWRVRMIVRPAAPVTRTERWCYGTFVLVASGGSILVFIAALPWVYHEAYAWAIACSIGALFSLLGLVEQPGSRGALATGAWVLAAVLTRTTGGWACALAVLLCAAWFASGRRGADARRHWWKVALAAAIPLLVGVGVNWAKFRHPWMFPLGDQVWTEVNEHRQLALEKNGGSLVGRQFFTTSLVNYFRPDGIRFTSIFPYITLPADPARAYQGAFVDQAYRTGSVTAFMPGFLLLALWGVVSAFRPSVRPEIGWLRLPVLGSLGITAGVMFYGYLAHRYTAEFYPVLVVAGVVGAVDLAPRLAARPRRVRVAVGSVIAVVAAFGVLANLATAVHAERVAARGSSLRDYVIMQERLSGLTGHPLDDYVRSADELPTSADPDELWIVGDCNSLWLSTGDDYEPWVPVEAREVVFEVTVAEERDVVRRSSLGEVRLMTFEGSTDMPVTVERRGRSAYRLALDLGDGRFDTQWFEATPGSKFVVTVRADPSHDRYVLGGPNFWSIPVQMRRWNDDWLSVPTLVAESPTAVRDGAEEGLEVDVVDGPTPSLCARLRERL